MTEEVYTLLFDIKSKGGNLIAQQANQGAKGMTNLNNATSNVNQTASNAQTNLNKTSKGIKDVKTSSSSAASSVRNFGSGMTTAAFGISTMATGIVGLQRSYRDLTDMQLGVDRAQLKVSKSTEALTKAKTKLKEVEKKNGKNSKEYAAAQLDVKQAQDAVNVATFNLSEKQEAYNDNLENFKLNLLPTFLGFGTTAAGIFSAFSGGADKATKATNGMGRGMKALTGILKLSPLFILAGVLLAIRTNAGGFRDMLDKLGAKLGEMFPGLKGFLNWVRDLGEALGLTGGKLDLHKAFDLLKSGFQSFVKTLETTDWSAVLQGIVSQIETWVNNTNWETVWNGFRDAMVATGTWIGEKLGILGKYIYDYFSNPTNQAYLWSGFQYAIWAGGSWLGEQLGKIFNAIYTYFSDPKVQEAIWNGIKTGLWLGGTWLYEQLGIIFNAIYNYFSDPKVQEAIWNGIKTGLWLGGNWLYEQLGIIFNAIYNYFSDPKVQQAIWDGFRTALWLTGTWIYEQLGKVFDAIYKYFADPKIQAAIWKGFHDAIYGVATWIATGLGSIAKDVGAYFANKKNTDAMWKGFRDALYAAGAWIQAQLLAILKYIGSWWSGHKDALTKGFAGFVKFIYDTAVQVGKSLPQKIIDGLVKAGSTLVRAGKFIWDKIAAGLGFAGKTLAQIGQAIANKLAGKKEGGIIQTAQAGKVFTTRGPTLTLAGDNPGGKETVAYIPHNNPLPTLRNLAKLFSGSIGTANATMQGYSGGMVAIIHVHINVGGRTTEEIIRQVEIGLGKNMRTIIA